MAAINQARFQDLINHLLHLQGNKFIGAPGSVAGKEKTSKGAPDSFFIDGDKYVFVECTTLERLGKSKTFFDKLTKDISHCFDIGKTGIAPDTISRIILACTDKISTEEFNHLKAQVKSQNSATELDILDIQNLPMHIYDFPGLSDQYTGVSIIRGEIYNLPDFLIKTTKGLQPSLANEFIGRADELAQAQQQLQDVDILLLSGSAGVGKSKLGVKLLEEIAEKEKYIPIVIQSSSVPLWDDFVHLFQNGRNYIMLFDDANKSVQNLSYLLDYIKKPRTSKLKVIITSRDYVKPLVAQRLNDSAYAEIIVNTLTDQQIGDVIRTALPALRHYPDISRKIIELSKGNARVALMATYSVTPGSQTNYLDSPVQLYEKYFEKLATEIDAFSKPIMLQAIAIVSFFGIIDRRNATLPSLLKESFGIDWDELWSAIMELHAQEILDVYSNEIVKTADQVLASYAFYKCFIDASSAVIDYGKWIAAFVESHSARIKVTLIDANNTFNYYHVQELVLPHLDFVLSQAQDQQLLYSFHSLFWFYKGRDTLLFIKRWIESLPSEQQDMELSFTYVHNDHSYPGKYFELLVGFWDHGTELLKPAVELGIDMVARQPARLPSFLKFMNDHFTYTIQDVQHGYQRQTILAESLLSEDRSPLHTSIATGSFLNITEKLLGWHFTEFSGGRGASINIMNFDLHISPGLLSLRKVLLDGLDRHFMVNAGQSSAIITKIVQPGAAIDRKVYVHELPFYEKLIAEKLSVSTVAHCKFVKKLVRHLKAEDVTCPADWERFTNSDLMRLAKFLKTDLEDKKGKTYEQREQEKRQEIQDFLATKKWPEIERFLIATDELYRQQDSYGLWFLEQAITEIYIGIAIKGKSEIRKALKMYFSGQLTMPLSTRVLDNILNRDIMTGKEVLRLINDHEFEAKYYWLATLLIALPESQMDLTFTKLLVKTFELVDRPLPIYRMSDFTKYSEPFERLKMQSSMKEFREHNLISCLTAISIAKCHTQKISLGHDFCQDCAQHFTAHPLLLKAAYIYLKNNTGHYDYDGEELAAVLKIDANFFVEYIEHKAIDSHYLSFRLENFKTDALWSLPNYTEIIHKCLAVMIAKAPVYSSFDHPANVLFTFKAKIPEVMEKVFNFISEYIEINHHDRQRMLMIMNVVLHRFQDRFIHYLKEVLLRNRDIDLLRNMFFDKFEVYTGSRVPSIQAEMDFTKEVIVMVKTLPEILSYSEHLDYLEKKVVWLKKDMAEEQRRDFQEFF